MFEVGERVVYANDEPIISYDKYGDEFSDCDWLHLLNLGHAYTVEVIKVCCLTGDLVISLDETPFQDGEGYEVCFDASRFRKLPDVKQSLSELKAIVANTPRVLEVEGV